MMENEIKKQSNQSEQPNSEQRTQFAQKAKDLKEMEALAETAVKMLLSHTQHPQSLVCKNFCYEAIVLHDIAQLDEEGYLNLKKVLESWFIAKDCGGTLEKKFLSLLERFSFLFQEAFTVSNTPVINSLKKVFFQEDIAGFDKVAHGLAGLLTAIQCADTTNYKFYKSMSAEHVVATLNSNIELYEKIEKGFVKVFSRNKMFAQATHVAFKHNYSALWRQFMLFTLFAQNLSAIDPRITHEERFNFCFQLSLPQQWYFVVLFVHAAILANLPKLASVVFEQLSSDKDKLFESAKEFVDKNYSSNTDDKILESEIID